MQESNTPTLSPTDELSAVVSALVGDEPEKAEAPPETEAAQVEAAEPEKAETEQQAAEKPAVDYGMKVPMQDGSEVTLGELKDAWQSSNKLAIEQTEREAAITAKVARAEELLDFIEQIPEPLRRKAEAERTEYLRKEAALTASLIPEAKTAEGMAKVKETITALTDTYGIPRQRIDSIGDAMTVKILYDYAMLKQRIREASQNVKPLRSQEPKGQHKPTETKSETQSAIDRAKRTRNGSDELNAVEAIIRSA